jgi:hypothetical protein
MGLGQAMIFLTNLFVSGISGEMDFINGMGKMREKRKPQEWQTGRENGAEGHPGRDSTRFF